MTTFPFFPKLYEHELFYSALARYKVRCGTITDKQLLFDVFAKRTIITSPEMPNGIQAAFANLQPQVIDSTAAIIKSHTLFPLYTAFSNTCTKSKIMNEMLSSRNNTYTTTTGIAACMLKPFPYMRYCSKCVKEQIIQYGEPYWDRRWFGLYTTVCPIHGKELCATEQLVHDISRHALTPLVEVISNLGHSQSADGAWQDVLLSNAATRILSSNHQFDFSFGTLTNFYRAIAINHNFGKGSSINQPEVASFIRQFWTGRWLIKKGFGSHDFESRLAYIFRKHRKQLQYPYHIVASLPFFNGDIDAWWNTLLAKPQPKYNPQRIAPENSLLNSPDDINQLKQSWLALVKKHGPKKARNLSNESYNIYTKLYRSDKDWLLAINAQNKAVRDTTNNRVDWQLRDYLTAKQFFRILYNTDDLSSPRRSKRWFLTQLKDSASVEHNLYRLPKCAGFLNSYSETVDEYQCRRLTQATIAFVRLKKRAEPWQLYRTARINTQRHISSAVIEFITWCQHWLIEHIR